MRPTSPKHANMKWATLILSPPHTMVALAS